MENFSSLPRKVDEMMVQLEKIAVFLRQTNLKIPHKKTLTPDEAVKCLIDAGYKISKSSLYKHTSNSTIPFSRFGSRIIFDRDQLLAWCLDKTTILKDQQRVIMNLSKTSRRK